MLKRPSITMPVRLLTALFLIPLFVPALHAQEQDSVEMQLLNSIAEMNRAFYANDPGALLTARRQFELYTGSADPEIRKLAHYYIGYASYRLSSAFNEIGEEEAKRHLNEAVRHLERAVEMDEDFAEAVALLGNCYGMKATGFFTGMKYGPKSQRSLDRAMELAPENPRVRLLYGISFMFKPAMFGGSLERAVEEMKRAADLFNENSGTDHELYPGWGSAEVYAWLGQACERAEDFELAEQYYKQALAVDPDYYWVKEILLPELNEERG